MRTTHKIVNVIAFGILTVGFSSIIMMVGAGLTFAVVATIVWLWNTFPFVILTIGAIVNLSAAVCKFPEECQVWKLKCEDSPGLGYFVICLMLIICGVACYFLR